MRSTRWPGLARGYFPTHWRDFENMDTAAGSWADLRTNLLVISFNLNLTFISWYCDMV